MLAWLNNMRMGTKLIFCFVLLTAFTGIGEGGSGIYNLMNVNNILLEITEQRTPSIMNATTVERFALRTILDEKKYINAINDERVDEKSFQVSAMNNIDEMIKALDEVDKVAVKYNDQDLISKSKEVRTVTTQYKNLYNSTAEKYQENAKLVKVMADSGAKVTKLVKAFYDTKVGQTDDQSLKQLSILVDIWDTALTTQLNQSEYMRSRNKDYLDLMNKGLEKLNKRFNDLSFASSDMLDLQSVVETKAATDDYTQAAKNWVKNDDASIAALAEMEALGSKVQSNAMAAEDTGWKAAAESAKKSQGVVSQAIWITIIVAGVLILIGILLGILISRTISRPLAVITKGLKKLANGDLNRDMLEAEKVLILRRKDEIGQCGQGLEDAQKYIQNMAECANRISENDLTVNTQTRSDKDELGIAFSRMLINLQTAVTSVAENAQLVSNASTELSNAANQAGVATSQIANTVNQVAKGITQQSEATSKTAYSVEQMSRAISGVASGAQEQANAVTKASALTSRISQAIQKVTGNAKAVTEMSGGTAEAARKGANTVEKTLTGMRNIKNKVGVSAEKVKEMGQRSDEIGAIIETIDDIASQTNLLALNAAIEAARAGEHGKGFAVVADEVRKLAERSSQATKEIGGLIKSIQRTVSDAVKAMDEGAKEVENGVELANEAGNELKIIKEATEKVYQQAKEAGDAANDVNIAATELVESVDTVSAVVEENTASTEEMSASSNEVTRAIENIASVSEENSAAIEEVSASTEEVSAQTEQVVIFAQSLAEMAQALQQVVAQFKLNQNDSSENALAIVK